MDETFGREEWKCWISVWYERIEWSESAEMKIGFVVLLLMGFASILLGFSSSVELGVEAIDDTLKLLMWKMGVR